MKRNLAGKCILQNNRLKWEFVELQFGIKYVGGNYAIAKNHNSQKGKAPAMPGPMGGTIFVGLVSPLAKNEVEILMEL
jgi:hypothetical protein